MSVTKHSSSSHHSVPSPITGLIATISQSQLVFRSSADSSIIRSVSLNSAFAAQCKYLRWYDIRSHELGSPLEHSESASSHRILIADDSTVHVYDAFDNQFRAILTGQAGSTGRIANVEFGDTPDEILVFTDFSAKVTIWSLVKSRGVEIRDPKFSSSSRGHSYRPKSGHLAIITRPGTQDVVMLLDPQTRELEGSFDLATTDAQGVKWSPDGRWLAIWDTASSGYRLLVYTADGQLYKAYLGGYGADAIGLGIKALEWNPTGAILAVSDYNDQVTLLSTNKFSPIAMLKHASLPRGPDSYVWQEQIDSSRDRSYIAAGSLSLPPTQSSPSLSNTNPKLSTGITITAFNGDGSLLATKSESTPTTVWIWPLKDPTSLTVIINHSPVQSIQWHPFETELLMIHCATKEPVLHLWSSSWAAPRVIKFRLSPLSSKTHASWLWTDDTQSPKLMLSNGKTFRTRAIYDEDDDESSGDDKAESATMDSSIQPQNPDAFFLGPEDMFDEGNSMDLSPVKFCSDGVTIKGLDGDATEDIIGVGGEGEQWDPSGEVDDTFEYLRKPDAVVAL